MACASLWVTVNVERNGPGIFLSKILNVFTSETFGDVFLRIFTGETEENVTKMCGESKNFYSVKMSFLSKTNV